MFVDNLEVVKGTLVDDLVSATLVVVVDDLVVVIQSGTSTSTISVSRRTFVASMYSLSLMLSVLFVIRGMILGRGKPEQLQMSVILFGFK